MSVIYFILL